MNLWVEQTYFERTDPYLITLLLANWSITRTMTSMDHPLIHFSDTKCMISVSLKSK